MASGQTSEEAWVPPQSLYGWAKRRYVAGRKHLAIKEKIAAVKDAGVHVPKHLMQEKKRPYREWLEAAEECKRREKKNPLSEFVTEFGLLLVFLLDLYK